MAIDEETGQVVDVADSVAGPTADIKLLEQSNLLKRLPPGVGGMGDLAYEGIDQLRPNGLAAAPRRKPKGEPRPPADGADNQAFSRRRIMGEQTIGRLRRYEAISQTARIIGNTTLHARWRLQPGPIKQKTSQRRGNFAQ